MVVDLIISLIVLISIVIGFTRGFVKEALTIVSWVVALLLAFTFYKEAGQYINDNLFRIPTPIIQEFLGGVSIFIVLILVFALINYLLHKLLVQEAIVGTDRALGVMLGVVRAVIIVAALIVLGRSIGVQSYEWWQNSKLLTYFESSADILQDSLPSGFQPVSEQQKQAVDILNNIEAIDGIRNQEVN